MSLHVTIILLPLHDIVSLAIHLGKSIIEPTFDGSEEIIFNLTLGKGEDGLQGEGIGVWGVVDKGAMRDTKQKRWDLVRRAFVCAKPGANSRRHFHGCKRMRLFP